MSQLETNLALPVTSNCRLQSAGSAITVTGARANPALHAARLEAMGTEKYRGLTRKSGGRAVWTGKIRLDHTSLEAPKAWLKPRKVFVNSSNSASFPE